MDVWRKTKCNTTNQLVLLTISKMTEHSRKTTGQKSAATGTTSSPTEKLPVKNGLRINTTYLITVKWQLVRISSITINTYLTRAEISWARKQSISVGSKKTANVISTTVQVNVLGMKQPRKSWTSVNTKGISRTGKASSRTMILMRLLFVSVTLVPKINISPTTLAS